MEKGGGGREGEWENKEVGRIEDREERKVRRE